MINREQLTPEEYKARLSELRKERDNLRRRADIIDREMDELESDSKLADFTIGKYIKLDRSSKGGYIEYFHVDTWVKDTRGVMLYGKGYSDSCREKVTNFHLDESMKIGWEEMNDIVEIAEEDFIKAYDKRVEEMREYLMNYKDHRPPRLNAIDFAEKLKTGQIKVTFTDDSLITKMINNEVS